MVAIHSSTKKGVLLANDKFSTTRNIKKHAQGRGIGENYEIKGTCNQNDEG